MTEHERAITRRLESFSDIVIGFCLAQMAINVVIPAHAIDFITHPVAIGAFLLTFVVVARFWWIHAEIMRNYFVPIPLMVLINFAALAAVVLQIFSLQLFVHFAANDVDGITAVRIYVGVFAITYMTLTALVALGMRARWPELSVALRRNGVRKLIGYGTIAVSLAIWSGHGWSLADSFSVTIGNERFRFLGVEGQLLLLAAILLGQVVAAWVARRVPAERVADA
jgi:uncharacterized membrane protein